MKLRSIYNPPKVYEGWYESYFIRPWVRGYADFNGGETGHDCLMSLLGWLIVTLGLAGVLMGLVGLLGPEVGFACLKIVGILWLIASFIPFCALLKRTFSGKEGKNRTPKFLGIDILQTVASLLFFIFGLLMMITTLNSEVLRGDPGTDETETEVVEEDTVVEEPIFTYQDAPVATATDTVPDTEADPDLIPPDESFDPTIAPAPVEALPDSLYF